MLLTAFKTQTKPIRIRSGNMKVTCAACGCNMKMMTSTFRYHCPECKNEIEIQRIQETNKEYWEKHKRNIEWVKIEEDRVLIVE